MLCQDQSVGADHRPGRLVQDHHVQPAPGAVGKMAQVALGGTTKHKVIRIKGSGAKHKGAGVRQGAVSVDGLARKLPEWL